LCYHWSFISQNVWRSNLCSQCDLKIEPLESGPNKFENQTKPYNLTCREGFPANHMRTLSRAPGTWKCGLGMRTWDLARHLKAHSLFSLSLSLSLCAFSVVE
jgi:hypothetical protein